MWAWDLADARPRGFHSTPVCGAFGAAAAAARVLGLSADQVEHAFGIVLSETSGNMQFHSNGAWTKRSQIGMPVPADSRLRSSRGTRTPVPRPLWRAAMASTNLYAEQPRPDLVLGGLGTDWQVMQIAFKPHAACRGTHAAIDAAVALREEEGLSFEDIDHVAVGLQREPLDLIQLLAEPEDRKRNPITTVDGQFSIHFCVAVALRLGRLAWDDYRTQFWNAEVRALMQRTTVFHDTRLVPLRPGSATGSVRVWLRDGRTFERVVNVPRGEPENMLTEDELRVKYASLVCDYLGSEGEARLFETAMQIDQQASLSELFAHARPA